MARGNLMDGSWKKGMEDTSLNGYLLEVANIIYSNKLSLIKMHILAIDWWNGNYKIKTAQSINDQPPIEISLDNNNYAQCDMGCNNTIKKDKGFLLEKSIYSNQKIYSGSQIASYLTSPDLICDECMNKIKMYLEKKYSDIHFLNVAEPNINILKEVENDKAFILGAEYSAKGLFFRKLNQIDNSNIEFSKAIDEFSKVIRKYQDCHLTFMARGNAYDSIGKYKEAIIDFDNAIQLFPNPIAYLSRGQSYYEIENYDLAIENFNTALLLNAELLNSESNSEYRIDVAALYNNRGNAYYKKEDFIYAYTDWGWSLRINPNNEILRKNYEKLQREIAENKK